MYQHLFFQIPYQFPMLAWMIEAILVYATFPMFCFLLCRFHHLLHYYSWSTTYWICCFSFNYSFLTICSLAKSLYLFSFCSLEEFVQRYNNMSLQFNFEQENIEPVFIEIRFLGYSSHLRAFFSDLQLHQQFPWWICILGFCAIS